MTNPKDRVQGGSGDNTGGGSGRRILLILAGMAAASIGAAMMLQSFRSDPAKFNVGLGLLLGGLGTAALFALKQDRRKQQPKKRNGDDARRRNT